MFLETWCSRLDTRDDNIDTKNTAAVAEKSYRFLSNK